MATTDSMSVERWLDAHPEFVVDYFVRKGPEEAVDKWLACHAGRLGVGSPAAQDVARREGEGSRSGSGTSTPLRRISLQELQGSEQLGPLVAKTTDGTPTFLRTATSGAEAKKTDEPRAGWELKRMDERELLYELARAVCDELDPTALCHKILRSVCALLDAHRCSLFLVQDDPSYAEGQCLAAQLFDVCEDSRLEESSCAGKQVKLPWGSGIVGHVAQTGRPVAIPDAYKDQRFNQSVDQRTGYRTHSLICMPIKDVEGRVIGVAQAINKGGGKVCEPFTEHDEKVFETYLAFCGIGLRNAQLYHRSNLEHRRAQVLLDLARLIFEEQRDVAGLIERIMVHTLSLLSCHRCQVLLVDGDAQGVFSQVFDLCSSDFDNDNTCNREGTEPRFPINLRITGKVASTGERVNIPDAYEDSFFDPSEEAGGDFRTRSLLCVPIRSAAGKVIGVCQLVNKLDGEPFSKNDENLLEAFSVFFGLAIYNAQMYEQVVRAMAKQSVALEVMSYHATARVEEADRLCQLAVPSVPELELETWSFSDFPLTDDETLTSCLSMFQDLDLPARFNIKHNVLCRWLVTVKKNYRSVTYHNWRHAFNVGQTMFAIIRTGRMRGKLSDLECLALLVGCLSHDLDHRGTNNSFQIKTMSPLGQLYSTSTMERHHFDQCIMILNTESTNILSGLNQQEYEEVMKMLESAILATDLALYFKFRGDFQKLLDSDNLDLSNQQHRELLRSMMMTACDVAAITKPWSVQKEVAELVAGEFFEQGDIEKRELNVNPPDMFNREKKDLLPNMQVGFIDAICMPVYKALSSVSEDLDPLLEGCVQNRVNWQGLADQRQLEKEKEGSKTESS